MIRNLTGIRGVAALWVLLTHYREYYVGLFPQLSFLDFISTNGHYGVDLFFGLSGFILGYVYFEALTSIRIDSRTFVIKDYFIKRFARVYPVYFLTSSLAGLFYLIAINQKHIFNHESASNFSIRNVVLNFLGIQTWFGLPSLNGPAWSVSAEFLVYLLFPIMIIKLSKNIFSSKFFTFMLLIVNLCYYEYAIRSQFFFDIRISQVISEFSMGVCTYILVRDLNFRKRSIILIRVVLTYGLILVLFFVKSQIFLDSLIPVLLLSLVATNYFHNIPSKGLGRKLPVHLGLWSYSLYLTHRLLQNMMSGLDLPIYETSLPIRILELSLLILLPVLLAWAVTRFIENPCHRIVMKRFS
jgi:peptidoglycan/LPS O-acetylase OafA/YrhL